MKKNFLIFIVIVPLILSACIAPTATALPSTETASPELTVITAVVSTVEPEPAISLTPDFTPMIPPPIDSTGTISADQGPASYTITLTDNGKTLNLHVGDSFLLNLGADIYDWNVIVDDQAVISLHMGVMVIKGVQGIFVAHIPGTTTLTATGDPHCRASTPPCMMPSILFKITMIVQ